MGLNSEQLERLQGRKEELYYNLQKQFMSLSAGAIVLSITFRAQIAGNDPVALWLLILSWWLFAGVIFCGLLEHRGHIAKWNLIIQEYLRGASKASAGLPPVAKRAALATFPLFLAAVLCLIIFASLNLPKSSRQSHQTTLHATTMTPVTAAEPSKATHTATSPLRE